MGRFDLTDSEWRVVAPLLPNKPQGVPRVDARRVLSGILWVLRTGGRRGVASGALRSLDDLLQQVQPLAQKGHPGPTDGCGFRSASDAENSATLRTIIATAQKQGRYIPDALTSPADRLMTNIQYA